MSFISVVFLMMILSVAATTAYISTTPAQQSEQSSISLQRMEVIKQAVISYRSQHGGASPSGLDSLVNPQTPGCSVDLVTSSPTYRQKIGWCGPYIDRPISQNSNQFKMDGWGTGFQYTSTTITSCGKDLACGTADDFSLSY